MILRHKTRRFGAPDDTGLIIVGSTTYHIDPTGAVDVSDEDGAVLLQDADAWQVAPEGTVIMARAGEPETATRLSQILAGLDNWRATWGAGAVAELEAKGVAILDAAAKRAAEIEAKAVAKYEQKMAELVLERGGVQQALPGSGSGDNREQSARRAART